MKTPKVGYSQHDICDLFIVMASRKKRLPPAAAADQEMSFDAKKGCVANKKHIKLSYSSTSSANNSDSEETSAMLT